MKRITLIAITAVLALGAAGALPAAAYAQDNAAVAVNTRDGTTVFRLAFKIVRVNQDVVDDANIAFAFASCSECAAIAIAFQAVLIFSDPSVVTTANEAWSLNYLCSECFAFGWAYQNVFTTGGPVHFTAEANQQLAEIRRALQELRKDIEKIDSWPTPPECAGVDPDLLNACKLESRLQPLKEQFIAVLQSGLVPAGPPPEEVEPAPTEPAPTETTTTDETTTETTTTETTTTDETTTTETTTSP
jgi:putative peptide zinc metalloprotease protein